MHATGVLQEKSINYEIKDCECKFQEIEESSQKLEKLIEWARPAQFASHSHYERSNHDAQEDLDTMKKAPACQHAFPVAAAGDDGQSGGWPCLQQQPHCGH
jgi:hypothetical protein